MKGRVKKGINYMTCPICFKGRVGIIGDQYYCPHCKSTWKFTAEHKCKNCKNCTCD